MEDINGKKRGKTYKEAGVIVYGPLKLTGMKIFVLNNNTIYCSVTFAGRTVNTKFIKFLYKVS
jgi:hypothetical protein